MTVNAISRHKAIVRCIAAVQVNAPCPYVDPCESERTSLVPPVPRAMPLVLASGTRRDCPRAGPWGTERGAPAARPRLVPAAPETGEGGRCRISAGTPPENWKTVNH